MKLSGFYDIPRNTFEAPVGGGSDGNSGGVTDGGAPPPGGNPGGSDGSPAPGEGPAGQSPGGGGPAAPYRPEGLADHYFGDDDRATIDNLSKAVSGFRQDQARAGEQGEVPKDAAGYQFEWGDALKDIAPALDQDDQIMPGIRDAALKHGLRTKQANGFVNEVLAQWMDADLLAEPFDPEKERALMAPDEKDPAARNAKVDALVRDNQAVVEGLRKQGLPDNAATFLSASLDRAAGNEIVSFMNTLAAKEVRPANGGDPAGALTQADLDKREADPRNRVGSSEYDEAFAKETTRQWRALYPPGG